MGFLDDAVNKAEEFAEGHPDQVGQGLDKAAQFADEKTGGKFSDQINQGVDFAKGRLGGQDDQSGQGGDNADAGN